MPQNDLKAKIYDYSIEKIEELIAKGQVKSWNDLAVRAGVHRNVHERLTRQKNISMHSFIKIVEATGINWGEFFKDFKK